MKPIERIAAIRLTEHLNRLLADGKKIGVEVNWVKRGKTNKAIKLVKN